MAHFFSKTPGYSVCMDCLILLLHVHCDLSRWLDSFCTVLKCSVYSALCNVNVYVSERTREKCFSKFPNFTMPSNFPPPFIKRGSERRYFVITATTSCVPNVCLINGIAWHLDIKFNLNLCQMAHWKNSLFGDTKVNNMPCQRYHIL